MRPSDFLPPEDIYYALFDAVQLSGIFQDSKTFVDAIPKKPSHEILAEYYRSMQRKDFSLLAFVEENFILPKDPPAKKTKPKPNLEEHLHRHWDTLVRKPDRKKSNSSLIPLPHPYIVPGGRFREIYYWDSYFTMLGLKESGRVDLIQSMIANFAHLINTIGFIPNGNRTYFLSRSQPPFFCKMVELLAEATENPQIIKDYQPELLMEYLFWEEGITDIKIPGKRRTRVVMMDEDAYLARYWDNDDTPRAESFEEDIRISEQTNRFPEKVFRNIRAACESGWDFSSRWLYDPMELKTIQTIAIIPIELNVLLAELEKVLLMASDEWGTTFTKNIEVRRQNRIEGINRYCWDEDKGIYLDYHIKFKERTDRPSLAMLFPLWAGIASDQQAERVLDYVEKNFLKPGGLVTTLIHSGQQWDAPNGWAPLQWIGFEAMRKYGREDMAKTLAERWTELNEKVYQKTGKMMEKYNVEDLSLEAGGGEYPVQDGFGWSNGVYLAMKSRLKN